MKPNEQNDDSLPAMFVLRGHAGARFKDIPLALTGYPKEEAGEPCHYLKRELIPIGERRQHPDDGYAIHVTPERADNWIHNFELMNERGHAVPAPPDHKDMSNSFGKWVSFAREPNATGGNSLYGVLKVVGNRTKEDVLNRDVSIFVTRGLKDDKGNQYDETLTHVSVTPYSALTGLSGWTSIAASRGPATAVPVFSLAASKPLETSMPLNPEMVKSLRQRLGAADDATDDKLIELALTKLGEAVPALELSRTQGATITSLTTRAEAAEAKVLELSKSDVQIPDAILIRDAKTRVSQFDQLLREGKCSIPQLELCKSLVYAGDKPNALMLSRTIASDGSTTLDVLHKVLELNKGLTGTVTGAQPLLDPNAVTDAMAEGRAEGERFQKQQQQSRGIAVA